MTAPNAERLCPECGKGGLAPRMRKHDECLRPKPTYGRPSTLAEVPVDAPLPPLPPGASRCPVCEVGVIEGRQRKCTDCYEGTTIDRRLMVAPVLPELSVIAPLRSVGPRLVHLDCGCDVMLDGRWWQGDEAECKDHGATWVSRISREVMA